MTLVTLLVVAALLFGLAFMTKRRYGVLGLGLTAGLVLSQQIAHDVADFLKALDVPVEPLPFIAAANVALIVAPALVLLFSGPKYTDTRYAIIGSVLFATFGSALLLVPLGMSLPFHDRASLQPFVTTVTMNSPLIISIAVIAAVVDTMHAHGKSPVGKKSKH